MTINLAHLKTFKQFFYKAMRAKLTIDDNTENQKQVAEAILVGTAAGAPFIPVAGPFISIGLLALIPAVKVGIDYNYHRNIEKAEARHKKLFEEFNNGIDKEIENTADEIVRIFEYQIASLRHDSNVQSLAEHASQRIISYKPEMYKKKYAASEVLTYQRFIRALIDSNEGDSHSVKTSIDHDKWAIGSIFKKSGIRKLEDAEYKFYVANGQAVQLPANKVMKPEKYGFREYIEYIDGTLATPMQPANVTGYYADHTNFRPSRILISSEELIEFAGDSQPMLIEFIRARHSGVNTGNFHIIYQGVDDLKDASGQYINLSGKNLSNLVAVHSNFKEVNFQGDDLKATEFIFANIDKCNFTGSRFDTTTKFYFVVCSSSTRFDSSAFVSIGDNNNNFSATFKDYIRKQEDITKIVMEIKAIEQAILHGQLTPEEKDAQVQHREMQRAELEQISVLLQDLKYQLGNEEMQSYAPNITYDYLERQDMNATINQHLEATNVLILHGFPGVGKSQLAINYAREMASSNTIVRYFNGDIGSIEKSEENAVVGFPKLRGLRGDELRKAIIDYLKQGHEFILVFDNVYAGESAKPVEEYIKSLSKQANGKILVTTNDNRLFPQLENAKMLRQLEVMGFNETEAAEFLSATNAQTTEEQLKKIAYE